MAITCDVRYGRRRQVHDGFLTPWPRRRVRHVLAPPRLVGLANALDLLISGRVILGGEAERCGPAERCPSREEVLPARSNIRAISLVGPRRSPWHSSSPRCTATSTCASRKPSGPTQRLVEASLDSPALAEGIAAFQEKRAPRSLHCHRRHRADRPPDLLLGEEVLLGNRQPGRSSAANHQLRPVPSIQHLTVEQKTDILGHAMPGGVMSDNQSPVEGVGRSRRAAP